MEILNYTIATKELKARGYTFQKLYAANYKCYRKQIGKSHTIWLWEKGRMIELNDWHQHTKNILEFYKANLDKHIADNKDLARPSEFMKLKVKEDTSEVSLKNMDEYFMHLVTVAKGKSEEERKKLVEDYDAKWEDYREVVIYIPNFSEVIKEIEVLTQ